MEQKNLTGSMLLLTPRLSFRTCGSPETLTSTKLFGKCGVTTRSGWQEYYILKTNLELCPKELLIDLRKQPPAFPSIAIDGEFVERVDKCKYPGFILDNK